MYILNTILEYDFQVHPAYGATDTEKSANTKYQLFLLFIYFLFEIFSEQQIFFEKTNLFVFNQSHRIRVY